MKVFTRCYYCGCKLQVTTEKTKEETTFICPSCHKVNTLDTCEEITTITDIVPTDNTTNSNKTPIMTEQLALEQLKTFCETCPF